MKFWFLSKKEFFLLTYISNCSQEEWKIVLLKIHIHGIKAIDCGLHFSFSWDTKEWQTNSFLSQVSISFLSFYVWLITLSVPSSIHSFFFSLFYRSWRIGEKHNRQTDEVSVCYVEKRANNFLKIFVKITKVFWLSA